MTAAVIVISVVLIAVGGGATVAVSYFRLQRHRADAVAMAGYRKLAEQAVAGQERQEQRLAELTERVTAIENLLRSVG